MSTLINKNNFEEIYTKTYQSVLKYIVCKCRDLDDVNELIQDCYIALYKILQKRKFIIINDETAYMVGIAKNIIKKYYRNKYKDKLNFLYFSKDLEDSDIQIVSNINLETDIINQENINEIWKYLNDKNVLIAKIFYLYYALGLKISEISKELKVGESTIKNYIYRTLKELKENFGKETKL